MSRKTKRNHVQGTPDCSEFYDDLRESVVHSIKTYFGDKSYFCGGPIPQKEMLSKRSVGIVMKAQNDDPTFNFIHEECLARLIRPKNLRSCTVHWTVKILLSLIEDMKKKQLPKDHQPGLILLYFKFCKGQQIPESLGLY